MRHDNTTRILANQITTSCDSIKTKLNNHDIIIGSSGTGKTRSYVIPNLLHAKDKSLIVCDTKGELEKQTSKALKKNGYKILSLDFTDCLNSQCGYNPFDSIRYDEKSDTYNEQDIIKLVTALVDIENGSEPFWDFAARQYLQIILAYILSALPKEEHNLSTAQKLLSLMSTGEFEKLINDLKYDEPKSFAVVQYELIRVNAKADKMDASIKGILAEKLATYIFDGVQKLYSNPNKIDFAALRKEPVAIFLNISDTDRSMDKLASLFYMQALQALCTMPIPKDDSVPFLPVHFFLDDFASNITIPDFDAIISNVRSRNINISIMLQSLSQLESMYSIPKARTIINNFDHLIYLGGMDVDTCRYIGTKADKSTQAILSLPLDEAILFERGAKPLRVKKW